MSYILINIYVRLHQAHPYSQQTTLALISLRRVVWWARPDQSAGLVDLVSILVDYRLISFFIIQDKTKLYTRLWTLDGDGLWANQVKGCVLRLLQLLFFCYEYITLVALTILPAGYRGQVAPL